MSNFTKLKLCHTLGISQNTHIWVKGALTALLLVLCGNVAKAQSDLTFKEGIRYSKWVIDSRMNDFYANTTKCGFAVYDQNGNKTSDRVDGKKELDYVVGLVAKSIIEASQYYSQFQWAQSFAKPWFLSIQNYGDSFYSKFRTVGGSLDDLNAVKLFVPLREMTSTDGVYPNTDTYNNTKTALDKAIVGLQKHNTEYSIKSGTLAETGGNYTVLGGWWHKEDYQNQMWLDGAYMGPALFAQLVNYSGSTKNIDPSDDWNLIVKQFEILHSLCWNSTDKLPYHAFAADGGTNITSHSDTWAGLSSTSPYCFHSASYWGRAAGWYFLALVDILEEMDKAGIATNDTKYTKLKGYLTEIAQGLAKRQDQATGGWYQILDQKDTYSASEYNDGKSHTATKNYIESSATALFTAAYLKAIRLKYIDEKETVTVNGTAKTYKDIAVNGYQCLVNNFFSLSSDGKVNIFGSCRSAGLGGSGDKYKSGAERFRDGSKAYYLLGYDVARVAKSENKTEGKVLGAFILAATEYERLYQNTTLLAKDLNPSYSIKSGEAISVEVLGDGKATYQWYDASTSPEKEVSEAKSASFTPKASGKYYCKITVTPAATSAKTRAASTGTYEITTRATEVTVSGESNNVTTTNNVIATFENLTSSTPNPWTAKESNEFTVSGIGSTKTYGDNNYAVKMSNAKVGQTATTIKLNVPEGYTVTSLKFTAISNSPGTDSEIKVNNTDKVIVEKKSSGYKEYEVTLTNAVTGPSTISITNSGEKELGISKILVLGYYGTPSTPTLYTVNFNAGTNGTCSTTSLKQESADASINLPEVTPNSGYTFDGWYTAAEGGNKVGSPYTPKDNITLYAHYTSTVSGPYVKFTTQPQGAVYVKDATPTDLSVVAETNTGAEISYQWYSNTTSSTEGGTAIYGEKKSTYTPSTATTGTTYYYCVASVTSGSETLTATSNLVSVAVVTAIYKYKVLSSDTSSPGVNGVKYITTTSDGTGKTGDKLVKMTFGGWKWGTNTDNNDHTYTMPDKDKTLKDSWSAAKTEGVDKLDGYDNWFAGGQDAVDESRKKSDDEIYGKYRYGWFKTKTTDSKGKVTTYPFTLPVRGAYMTFEPTKNGWLTIYILQNGVWNTYDKATTVDGIEYAKGAIKPGEFRMHSFFITNQRGLTVQDFAPGMYSYDVNQKVQSGYSCSIYERDKKPAESEMNKHGKDVSYWPEFWTLDDDEREAVYTHWKDGDNGSETVIELSNGSFLLIQKAVIKYRFHVTGNETYYFFSNFSKMGFSGATFQPDDAQPAASLSLSDTKQYAAPTADTDGKVDNVTIPQYNDITLNRTFKRDLWTTLTLPFNLTQEEVQKIFGKGTQLIMLNNATLSSEGGARLEFIYHEIQNVLPGYPYLIKPTLVPVDNTNDANVIVNGDNNTITSFTVYGKCINPSISQFEVDTTPYTFMGTPDYCTADLSNKNNVSGYSVKYKPNDIFVSEGDGKLYVSGDSSYGKGYRAWLQKKETDSTTTVKSISVVMSSFSDDDDTTTSIDVAEMAPDLIEALGIQTGVYNLSGQRVANDTRNLKAGIYIVNGKKTVVR